MGRFSIISGTQVELTVVQVAEMFPSLSVNPLKLAMPSLSGSNLGSPIVNSKVATDTCDPLSVLHVKPGQL